MRHFRTAILSLFFATTTCLAPLQAQDRDSTDDQSEPEVASDTRRCLSTRSIRRIRIIDDKNVLIYQSANRIFHNVLRNSCHGLKRLGTFSYNSSDGQLCEGDGIAALTGAWDDVRPIPRCWLGMHTRITKEHANALREGGKRGPMIETKPLPMPEPEEVTSEPEDPDL